MSDSEQFPEPNSDGGYRENLALVGAVIGILCFLVVFGIILYGTWGDPSWNKLVFEHPAGVIGLPAAAAGAFLVVVIFRTAEGKIKFKVVGFSFEGASGPIVMWTLCFLAISFAMKLLW
jgi:hypothetical protein